MMTPSSVGKDLNVAEDVAPGPDPVAGKCNEDILVTCFVLFFFQGIPRDRLTDGFNGI